MQNFFEPIKKLVRNEDGVLVGVEFENFFIDERTISRLTKEKNVRKMDIANCKTQKPLADWIGNFPKLAKLHILKTKLGPNFFVYLSDLMEVTILDLPQCKIKDTDLLQYKPSNVLNFLNLMNNNIEGPGLESLKSCKALDGLRLDGNPLGDSALNYLIQCQSITGLGLNNTKITEACVSSLNRMRKLDTLNIRGNILNKDFFTNLDKSLPINFLETSVEIFDRELLHELKKFKKLKSLYVYYKNYSEFTTDKIEKLLPGVTVLCYEDGI
jgi:Leucine-rich repeat (LRR) protein